jgi:hypothetical protein
VPSGSIARWCKPRTAASPDRCQAPAHVTRAAGRRHVVVHGRLVGPERRPFAAPPGGGGRRYRLWATMARYAASSALLASRPAAISWPGKGSCPPAPRCRRAGVRRSGGRSKRSVTV